MSFAAGAVNIVRRIRATLADPGHPDAIARDEVERIRRALRHREHDGKAPPGASAVLAPLVPTPSGLFVLLERRPLGRSFFSGHLGFPGGRIEAQDPSPLSAALRETREEIGIGADAIEILGHLDDSKDPFGRRVSCFVGVVPEAAAAKALPAPDEVDEILLAPLDHLREPLHAPRLPTHGPVGAYSVTGYESRALPSQGRVVHYWNLQRGARDATLWGFTAGLVALLLERVYGWTLPRPPRVVDRWEDLQP
ncbi:MAG: CoA pyrophosphatase [Euryarchaeota archaeon]|nr:CoA pyrophosphatase [Euryarchaeota archaeon]